MISSNMQIDTEIDLELHYAMPKKNQYFIMTIKIIKYDEMKYN